MKVFVKEWSELCDPMDGCINTYIHYVVLNNLVNKYY